MSQVIFDTILPTTSGTQLATILNDFKNAVVSGLSGPSRPTELDIGGAWVDTTNDPTSWSFKIWTGTADVEVFKINLTTGLSSVALAVDSFTVKKISADTFGSLMELVKRRVANSGQVLDGDVVGEIRITGRTNSATDPVVAKIIWTATDDQTTTAYGGTLSFQSVADGSSLLEEHMRFINGLVETVKPLRINSEILVGQNVATQATISALSASKILVEMTGSTATSIQGLNAAQDSKVVTIHNRSTANVTLSHEDAGATATNRIVAPGGVSYVLRPQASATLYYSSADSRWKFLSTSEVSGDFKTDTILDITQNWTAPATTSVVKVTGFRKARGIQIERAGFVDQFGNAWSWGANANSQIGDNTAVPKSSPVIVIGGRQFARTFGSTTANASTYGIDLTGQAFGWGHNASGQLGDNTVTGRASPSLVVGPGRFAALFPRDSSCYGVTLNGTALAWGINANGQLGDNSVVPKSSPVAVLGGRRYSKIVPISGLASNASVVGITRAGEAFAWGINTNGQLGDNSVVPKSSPVAVLGGHTFKDIVGGALSSTTYFYVGLTSLNTLVAWGANAAGQLGVGDTTPRSSPVAVVGGLTFSRIFASPKASSVYALATNGQLYAWGENTFGQLGVGDTVNRSSPTLVLGGNTFREVYPYRNAVLAIRTDGGMRAWGQNVSGSLGTNDVVNRSSPVAVVSGVGQWIDAAWVDGVTDQYSVRAVFSDGLLYAWGANANGTLGVNDVTPRSTPTLVIGSVIPDSQDISTSVDLSVTPGESYTVTTGPIATFGNAQIGFDIYKIEVQYLS